MKAVWIIVGLLCFAFAIAQLMQAMGLIGTKSFSIAGVALILLGIALGAACIKKAFTPTVDNR